MNWNQVALITYGFVLGLILLFLARHLFARTSRPQKEDNETRKIDFQQIERLVRLHQEVKDDLSRYGDVLVAMHQEWRAAQGDLQQQIDECRQAQALLEKKPSRRQAARAVAADPHEQAVRLARYGMEPDQIGQKTGLSQGEIDLILHLQKAAAKEKKI